MRKVLALLAAVALAGFGLAVASPAQAHHNLPTIAVGDVGACGEVTLAAAWSAETHTVGNTTLVVSVGGVVHTAPVGESITVGPFDTDVTVRYRVWGGGERDYDVPGLLDLPALLAWIAAGGSPLDVDAAGVAWLELDVEGCVPSPRVKFADRCGGTLVFLANRSRATGAAVFVVNGLEYGPLPPGGKPEPLLISAATIVVVSGEKTWEHEWRRPRGCPKVVTPAPPTVTAPACDAGSELDLPEVKGVRYEVAAADPQPGGLPVGAAAVDVTAVAKRGYRLDGGDWTWQVVLDPAQVCTSPSPSVSPSPSPVAPSPSVSPSPVPVVPGGQSGGGLPLTGTSGVLPLAAGGLLAIVAGLLALVLLHRRRRVFAAE